MKIYVATNGRDTWSGTRPAPNKIRSDGPLASVEEARNRIRQLRVSGKLNEPVNVYVRKGIYPVAEPLVFAPEDSGTGTSPVTYQAYKQEHPVLSGGRTLRGFKKDKTGLWTLRIPEVKKGTWYFNQLFVNGERRDPARVPSKGAYFRVKRRLHAPLEKQGFHFFKGDIKNWKNLDDVRIVLFHCWDAPVHSIDTLDLNDQSITFTQQTTFPIARWERNPRYYVVNVPEGLSDPGSWYLDRAAGTLYYHPLPGEKINTTAAVAPMVTTTLVHFEGAPETEQYVEHLFLRGLAFQHANADLARDMKNHGQAASNVSAAIVGNGARHCRIENCEIAHVGDYGIWMRQGSRDVTVVKCHIHDLGAGGVRVGEGHNPIAHRNVKNAGEDNYVTYENNFIHDGGHVYHAAVGVWIGRSSHNRVLHNEICDFDYSGISVGWTWRYEPSHANNNIIEYNRVHHVGRGVLSDMAGIYSLGISPGTRIRNNVIHDVYSYPGASDASGIYTDEASSDILIENNIIYRVSSCGHIQHYGLDNTIQNNIYAFTGSDGIRRCKEDSRSKSFRVHRNIVYAEHGRFVGGRIENNQYEFDKNLYFSTKNHTPSFGGLCLSEWHEHGHDTHSLIADPRFENAQRYNFTLKPDSPALHLGFEPIDTSRVGLVGEKEWTSLPRLLRKTRGQDRELLTAAKKRPTQTFADRTAQAKQRTKPTQLDNGPLVLHLRGSAKANGRLNDLSPYGNHAHANRAVQTTKGQNAAILFGDDESMLLVPHSQSLHLADKLTLMARVKPSDTWNYTRIITKPHHINIDPYNMFGLMFDDEDRARMEISIDGKQHTVEGTSQISCDTWTHIAGTYDGAQMKIYVNGKLENTLPASGKVQTNDMPICIGLSGFGHQGFNGAMNDVRVYAHELNTKEVRSVCREMQPRC